MVSQRFKKISQKAKEAKEFWDSAEDPQDGLVQLGNSPFYGTPDEPADPQDCNRYPDSPFCGGNPLTLKPIDLSVSLVRDECNLGIQFDGAIGFIKVPPAQIVYRNPDCIPPPPPPPEKHKETEEYENPSDLPSKECNGKSFCIAYQEYHLHYREGIDTGGAATETSELRITLDDAEYPYTGEYKRNDEGAKAYAVFQANSVYKGSGAALSYTNGGISESLIALWQEEGGTITGDPYSPDSEWKLIENQKITFYRFDTYHEIKFEKQEILYPGIAGSFEFYEDFIKSVENSKDVLNIGRSKKTYSYTRNRDNFPINVPSRYDPRTVDIIGEVYDFYGVNYVYEDYNIYATETAMKYAVICGKFTPPPPTCMCCCPNVEQNDQLLRLILKRIGTPKEVMIFDEDLDRKGAQHVKKKPPSLNDFLKLAVDRTEIVTRIVGIQNFPLVVPDTVIEPYKEGAFAKIFDFIDGEKKRTIHTIAELIAWQAEQDSAVLGEFHQVIEYETGESDNKGKPKTGKIVLPNVAETLKEITLLVAQMAKQNNVQTDVIFKLIAETVATRATASKAVKIVEDIQDYLDYPTERKVEEIQTSINLPAITKNKDGIPKATKETESYTNFMKQGSVKFVFEDWTGKNSLHDQLVDLLQLAAMLRAIYYQRTDK